MVLQLQNIFTDTVTQWICIFCILDFVTGFSKGVKNKEVTSKKLRDGLTKKFQYIIIIILCVGLHQLGLTPEGFTLVVQGFIIFVETTSIIENIIVVYPELGKLGLTQVLKVVKNPFNDNVDNKINK